MSDELDQLREHWDRFADLFEREMERTTEQTATAESGIAALGTEIVGRELYGANNEQIGDIEDVVMSEGGEVEAVLTDVGGFLGIGAKRVAVPIDQLQMQDDRIVASRMTREEAENMPEYQE